MKILYGVQGTGNGHITRSSILIPILRDMGHEVEVIISGRNNTQLGVIHQKPVKKCKKAGEKQKILSTARNLRNQRKKT